MGGGLTLDGKSHEKFPFPFRDTNADVDIKGSRYRYILGLAVHLSGGLRK